MFIEINGVDLSNLTTKYGYEQTPSRRHGVNEGTDGLGNPIQDLLCVAYTVNWNIRPATASTVKVFADICKAQTVLVRYFSAADNSVVTRHMVPTLSAIPLALKDSTKEIYYGMSLTLEEIVDE